ncbi:hypothetical protein Tco_1157383, partial [Tanacetum coccineum]
SGYQQKDRKPSQNDKTEHGMEKTVQNQGQSGNPKSPTFEIYHGGCFTPTPSRSYVGGQVSSVDVVNIDEFCLHDLKDMVLKLGYGVVDLMYYHFLRPRLGLDYGLYPLNVNADVLEMAKYVKDNKIIFVYVEHGSSNVDSSIFVTPKKGVAIVVDNHLRKAPIEIDSSPDVNRNLTPMCHRNLTKEWELVSSKALSIGEVMKNLSKKQPASFVEGPIVVETADPFDGLDEILGDYINTREEITKKQMIVHVEVEVDADNKTEEESDTKENDTSGSDSEDLDYDLKHDEVFDDDEHILEDVPVSMNNFNFNPDTKHDLSIAAIEGIKKNRQGKKQGPNKYYFYLGQQFASKEIVKGRLRKHSVETRRKLILVKNDKERTMLVPYTNEDHVMKTLATNPDIHVRAVQDQMQKKFNVRVLKMKAFRAKRIISDKMTDSFREHYSLLREYTQELINQNLGTTVRIDVQQEPNTHSPTRTFRRVYVCLGSLKQGLRACSREILGLDGCFMSGPWPARATTIVEFNKTMGQLKSYNFAAYDWLMKFPAE